MGDIHRILALYGEAAPATPDELQDMIPLGPLLAPDLAHADLGTVSWDDAARNGVSNMRNQPWSERWGETIVAQTLGFAPSTDYEARVQAVTPKASGKVAATTEERFRRTGRTTRMLIRATTMALRGHPVSICANDPKWQDTLVATVRAWCAALAPGLTVVVVAKGSPVGGYRGKSVQAFKDHYTKRKGHTLA